MLQDILLWKIIIKKYKISRRSIKKYKKYKKT